MTGRKTGRTAFTMIEVIVVMLVMGILAAVAAPRYGDINARFSVEAAARRIVADLNQMRGIAMTESSQEEWVSFDTGADKYHMWFTPDPDHPANEYWVEFSKTAYPVDLVSATFTNTDGFTSNVTVKFDMYGIPKTGTPVAPLTSGQIVIASGSEQRTIIIDPVTGKASVQ